MNKTIIITQDKVNKAYELEGKDMYVFWLLEELKVDDKENVDICSIIVKNNKKDFTVVETLDEDEYIKYSKALDYILSDGLPASITTNEYRNAVYKLVHNIDKAVKDLGMYDEEYLEKLYKHHQKGAVKKDLASINVSNKEPDWPTFYPEHLKLLSWCIDGKVAGPYRYWNKHLDKDYSESPIFIKSVMIGIFEDKNIRGTFVENYVTWIADRLVIYMGYNDTEFKYSLKKEKYNDKDYCKMAKKELGFDKQQAMEMLKHVLGETLKFYNTFSPTEDDIKYTKYDKKLTYDKDGHTVGFSKKEEAMLNDMMKEVTDERH